MNQSKLDKIAIDLIIKEYQNNDIPWFIGYSGGKDSSALLKLVFNAFLKVENFHKPVTVVYCDTKVENPIITSYVYEIFENLKQESIDRNIPLNFKIATPVLDDRYFVKVIGRGYPPPTNIFRWCTDKLRIKPISSIIDNNQDAIVLLGIRNGESEQRDRTISKHTTSHDYYLKQSDSKSKVIFSPIIKHGLEDIWITIRNNKLPRSIDYQRIRDIYKDAESECPILRNKKDKPCGNNRFGCWTCTVVRKDKSVSSMIDNGYYELEELLNFRNWLIEFRDDIKYRCDIRRNGQIGLGPITIEGRSIILERLLDAQRKSKITLISSEELARINELWKKDLINEKYKEKITPYNTVYTP